MDFDDIIYMLLLVSSIVTGYFYRRISDKESRKAIGTGIGLLIVLIVSKGHIVHSLITVLVNAAIILCLDKRNNHLICMAFSFIYLIFFRTTIYFGIPYPPGHTNLVQMMLTLKLVGLAFDLNTCHYSKKKRDSADKTEDEKFEDEYSEIQVTFMDIIHYCFNYIGVLTGPFIRYRTFNDYFEKPFSRHANWSNATLYKLKFVPVYAFLFLYASSLWPLSYAKSEEFYEERSFLYRLWYIWPNFFIFRMRIYIGLLLSECVCTVAGMGAYPTASKPRCGQGPSQNFKQLMELEKDESNLATAEYDFETIHNVNPYGAEFCPTFRESMKHWNMCIQYWLAVNIYKRFPSKKYRTLVTMLVSAFWHGVYAGYYVCLGCAPFVLPVDDVFYKLLIKDQTGWVLKVNRVFMVFFKMFFFSYLAIAFHLLSLPNLWHYYNSIYHFGIIFGLASYVVGVQLLKLRKKQQPRPAAEQAKKTE